MRTHFFAIAAFFVASMPVTGMAANAQQSQDWQWCMNEDRKFLTDLAARGCSAVYGRDVTKLKKNVPPPAMQTSIRQRRFGRTLPT